MIDINSAGGRGGILHLNRTTFNNIHLMAFKIFQCVLMPSRCFTVNNVVRSDISNGKIPQHVANGKNSTDSAYGENILFSSDHHSFILLWFCFSKLLYCFLKRNKNREKTKNKRILQ